MAEVKTKPSTLTGQFRHHSAFSSQFLPVAHDIIVYVPPGYDAEAERRYPVLYLHDGQNLFDDRTAFSTEWQVDESAQALIQAGEIDPVIIVGIHNAGAYRIEEYTPTRDRAKRVGGKAKLYGRMIVEELKPFIDAEYRTLPDPEHTALGGSSLGGLVSLYLGLLYSGVFWKLAVLSPSVWWDNRFIVRRVRALADKPPIRIWFSMGTAEGDGAVDAARRVRDALIAKGWLPGEDLAYREIEGGRHHETAWAAVVPDVLRFFFRASEVGNRESIGSSD